MILRNARALFIIFCLISAIFAQPRAINYQGKLTNPTGVAIDDTVSINFRICSALAGGIILWQETHPAVAVEKGLFDAILGSTTPITLPFDTSYFIELVVEGELLTPRTAFNPVPYAFRAFYADTAIYALSSEPITGGGGYIWNQDTVIQSAKFRISGTATAGTLAVADARISHLLFVDNLPADAIHDSVLTVDGGYVKKAATGSLRVAFADSSRVSAYADSSRISLYSDSSRASYHSVYADTADFVLFGENPTGYIWNQDTIVQSARFRISGTATAGTLAVNDIRGQGYIAIEYSGAPIPINNTSFITLFTSAYNSAGPGSGVSVMFTGTFDDRANKKGAGIQIQLVRNPGVGEVILTSQNEILTNRDIYSDRAITLTAMDFPPAGLHTYAIRAKMLYEPFNAGRFVKGNIQIVEVKQ